jgi:hypothetical protein
LKLHRSRQPKAAVTPGAALARSLFRLLTSLVRFLARILSMTLITKAQSEQLLANGIAQRVAIDRQDQALDFKPAVRLFTPDAQCTWLLTEIDEGTDLLAFGLCDLGMGCPELGYVSLMELRAVRGKLGLPIERDLHFEADKPISAFADEARKRGHIIT